MAVSARDDLHKENEQLKTQMAAWKQKDEQFEEQGKQVAQLKDQARTDAVKISTQAELIEQLKKTRLPSPESNELQSKQFWMDHLPKKPSTRVVERVQTLEEALKKVEQEDPIRPKLLEWLKATQKLLADSGKWPQFDGQLVQHLRNAIAEPWDKSRRDVATQYIAGLDGAKKTWSGWITDPSPDFEDLWKRAESRPEAECAILKRWLGGFAGPQPYTLQLKSASAGPGLGKGRRLLLYSGDTEHANPGVDDWSEATVHEYGKSDQVKFQWKPNQSLRIWLGGDWSVMRAGGRPTLIDQTYTGPLAAWLMYRDGEVSQGGVKLRFHMPNFPGPPAEMFRSIDSLVPQLHLEK